MLSISAPRPTSPASPALPAAAVAPTGPDASPGSGDLLAAMNPAMDAAFAVGRPTDAGGAAAILATTGSYIEGANATITKLEQGMGARERSLERLRRVDPAAADKAEAQLEMLRRLRDRIQLSVERVSQTIAGGDSSGAGIGGTDDDDRALERIRRKREELELLEQRRQLLAPAATHAVQAVDPSMVASSYATGARA